MKCLHEIYIILDVDWQVTETEKCQAIYFGNSPSSKPTGSVFIASAVMESLEVHVQDNVGNTNYGLRSEI